MFEDRHCCLVTGPLLLQTLDSQWVVHEVEEARAYGIPIICVVDIDRQTQREVIDKYMEKGYGMSVMIHICL